MNETIEALCEKFNTTAETLIAVMAEYYRTDVCVTLTIAVVIFLFSALAITVVTINERKKSKLQRHYTMFDDVYTWFVMGIAIAFGIVAFTLTALYIGEFIMSARYPDAYAINKILYGLQR